MLAMFLFIFSLVIFVGYSGWFMLIVFAFTKLTVYEQRTAKIKIGFPVVVMYTASIAYIIAYIIKG